MAVYTVSNTGGNYNVGTTWVGGVVPSTTDSVAFTTTSGNLTINVGSTCAGINFTDFTGNIIFNAGLTSTSTINFGSGGYTVTGSNSLSASTTATIISNGTAWQGNFKFLGTSQTYTLADNMTVNGALTLSATTQVTLNGFTLYCKGNVSHTTASTVIGSTVIVLNGTSTWNHTGGGTFNNTISINTTGVITLSTIRLAAGANLSYVAGTIIATSSTLYLTSTVTLDTNGINWNNISSSGSTITNNSTLKVVNTLTITATTIINGSDINTASLTHSTTGNLTGTSLLVFDGTGTWTHTTTTGYLGLNTTINTAGTITFGGGGVRFGGSATLTYVSGTVVATTPFYVNGTCSLNVAPIAFNAFQINGISTVCTLLDNITVNGELRFNGSTACTVNGFNIYCNSNVYIQPNYTINGTTVLQLVGASMTWTHQTVSYMGLPIVINTSGTLTFGVNGLRLSGGTSLIYTAGTLAGSYYLYFGGSRILDLNTSVWLSVTNNAATTLTLLSDLNLSGELRNGSGTLTINGLYKVYIGGNLTRSSNTVFSGTASLVMNGTGTWSDLYQAQIFGFDLTINTTGTITISGTVRINEAFTYVAGTVITTGSTLVLPSNGVSYDLNGIVFNIVQFNGGQTRTFLSDMTCNTLNVLGAASTTNGSSIYFNNLQYQTTAGSIGLGTTTFVFAGTGIWSHSTTGRFNNNLIIDTGVSGVTTFTAANYITNGTVTHISGSVSQGVYILTLAGSATMDTSGMTWGTLYVNGGVTTLLSTLKADRIQNNGFTTMTFAGAFGFEVDEFALTTAFNITVTLVNGVRYLIKQSILSNTPGYTRLFTCASGAALLDLQYGATQNLANTSATRINSLGGQTIYTTGTLTSTQNWNTGTYRNPTNFMIMF